MALSRKSLRALLQRERVLVSDPTAGCFVAVYDGLLSAAEASSSFTALRDTLPWRTEVDDFGEQDRRSFFAADKSCTFRYVGLTLTPPAPPADNWVPALANARAAADSAARAVLQARCGRAWLEQGHSTATGAGTGGSRVAADANAAGANATVALPAAEAAFVPDGAALVRCVERQRGRGARCARFRLQLSV